METDKDSLLYPLLTPWLNVILEVSVDGKDPVPLKGHPVSDLRSDIEAIVFFENTAPPDARITVKFIRTGRRDTLPLMAAAHTHEPGSFGFSLEQCAESPDGRGLVLPLVYTESFRQPIFKPLFLKVLTKRFMDQKRERPYYLRITLDKMDRKKSPFLIVHATEKPESDVPRNLVRQRLHTDMDECPVIG